MVDEKSEKETNRLPNEDPKHKNPIMRDNNY